MRRPPWKGFLQRGGILPGSVSSVDEAFLPRAGSVSTIDSGESCTPFARLYQYSQLVLIRSEERRKVFSAVEGGECRLGARETPSYSHPLSWISVKKSLELQVSNSLLGRIELQTFTLDMLQPCPSPRCLPGEGWSSNPIAGTRDPLPALRQGAARVAVQ